jgi:hypothetical protein
VSEEELLKWAGFERENIPSGGCCQGGKSAHSECSHFRTEIRQGEGYDGIPVVQYYCRDCALTQAKKEAA